MTHSIESAARARVGRAIAPLNDAITGSRVWGSIQIRSSTVAGGSPPSHATFAAVACGGGNSSDSISAAAFVKQRSD